MGTAFDAEIRDAIARRRLIGLRYNGRVRLAEPHDYGVNNGVLRLFVFQVDGPSAASRPARGWRLLDAAKIEALIVTDESFPGSRGGAHQKHLVWDPLYARVT